MDKLDSKLMIWKDGKLWVSPQGQGQFNYWRSFSWLEKVHNLKLKQWNVLEMRVGLGGNSVTHSDGWFAYQILRDIGYQLISEKQAKSCVNLHN